MIRLVATRIIIILLLVGLFPLFFFCFYNGLIIAGASDSFREGLFYDIKFKNNLNYEEAFDSLMRENSQIVKKGNGWECYSMDKSMLMRFNFPSNDTILCLSSYEFNSTFRKKFCLIFPGNHRYLYGIDSNYEASKVVQDAFESDVLSQFSSEFHVILPKTYYKWYGGWRTEWYSETFYNKTIVRDKAWWEKRDFDVIYLPIGTYVLLCISLPILACALRRNVDKIRILKAEQNKSRKEE